MRPTRLYAVWFRGAGRSRSEIQRSPPRARAFLQANFTAHTPLRDRPLGGRAIREETSPPPGTTPGTTPTRPTGPRLWDAARHPAGLRGPSCSVNHSARWPGRSRQRGPLQCVTDSRFRIANADGSETPADAQPDFVAAADAREEVLGTVHVGVLADAVGGGTERIDGHFGEFGAAEKDAHPDGS